MIKLAVDSARRNVLMIIFAKLFQNAIMHDTVIAGYNNAKKCTVTLIFKEAV